MAIFISSELLSSFSERATKHVSAETQNANVNLSESYQRFANLRDRMKNQKEEKACLQEDMIFRQCIKYLFL
jgi:hypothetical protein